MAWEYDPTYNVFIDSDDGEVQTPEGDTLGWLEDDGSFTSVDDLDVADDDFTDDPADEAVAAGYAAGQDAMRSELADLRTELAEAMEAQAISAGYAMAQQDLDDAEAAEEASENDFTSAIQMLSENLGRPISETEAERIGALLPDRPYNDSDVSEIAGQLGIHSFSPNDGTPHSRARSAESRADYLNIRARELGDASDAGEFDYGDAGMAGDLLANAEAENLGSHDERLRQATALDYGTSSRNSFVKSNG